MNNEFNLERAIAGEPIETVFGTPAEFIAYRSTAKASKQVIVQDGDDVRMYYVNGRYHGNHTLSCSFDLRMKHVLQKIDWSNIPEDTVISTPEGDRHIAKCSKNSTLVLTYPEGKSSLTCGLHELEEHRKDKCYLVEQQPWIIWQGGENSLPDGLEFEVIVRFGECFVPTSADCELQHIWVPAKYPHHVYLGHEVIAYRLTGKVMDGYSLC
jgi:hypothetical protein